MKKKTLKMLYALALSTAVAVSGGAGTIGTMQVAAAQARTMLNTQNGIADFRRGDLIHYKAIRVKRRQLH